jgi:acetylornithine/N-succinyldiaminopimelate aminotransferase
MTSATHSQQGTSSADWQAREARVFFQAAKRAPVTIARGKGTEVFDVEGKRYLDFVAGIAVNCLGHDHPVLVDAVTKQAHTLVHISNIFYSEPQVELAELLVDHSCFDRAWFCNSGAEAIEAAIKLAEKWGGLYKDGADQIICAWNGFHGRTTAALGATGTPRYQEPFKSLISSVFVHVPFDDVEAIRAAITPKTVAVLLEPVQGEGGVNVPDPGYLRAVRELCDANNVLLVLDEIQTGVARTGTLWAYERYGIEPDMMTLAKGLAGGVPIGAVLAKEQVAACFVPGDHGSTFGGNPLATAAGAAVLRYIIDQDIATQVEQQGQRLMGRLRALEDAVPGIKEVRGVGLLCAIEFEDDVAGEINARCIAKGLLVNTLRPNTLRFSPPLIVSDAEIDEALTIFGGVLRDVLGEKRA